MKNILLVSAVAWLLTIALALVSSPSKSAGTEPLKCLIQEGGMPDSKLASKSPLCEAYVGGDVVENERNPMNVLNR